MFNVYLAGPISGLSYEDASLSWRVCAVELFADAPEIRCYSPMRAKSFLADRGKLSGSYEDHPLATERGIVTRDRNDVKMAHVMIANFLESQGNYSLGTAIEFGWADFWTIPVIMVADENDPHRRHPMLSRMAGFIVDDLETAVTVTKQLLLPGV